MTTLASTVATRHDLVLVSGVLLFIAGAGLLVGCLLAAVVIHRRRHLTPLPVEPVAPSPVDETPTRVIPVVQVFTEQRFDPDQTARLFVVRDHGGPRW